MAIESGIATLGASGWAVNPAPRSAVLARPRKFCLVGDSHVSRGVYNVAVTSAVAVNDLVTVNATLHSQYPGGLCSLANANEDAFNGVFYVDSVVDANNFKVLAPGSGTRAATGAMQALLNARKRDLSAFEVANVQMGHPFSAPVSAGFPGKTLTYVAANIAKFAWQYGFDAYVIQAGINDAINCAAGQETATLQSMIASAKYIIEGTLAKNALPIFFTVPPLGGANGVVIHGSYTVARAQLVEWFNHWLRSVAKFLYPTLVLVDAFRAVSDPVSGDYVTGLTSDGSHPNAKAVQIIANEMVSVLAGFYYPQRGYTASADDNYTTNASNPNIIVNPLFLTGGGALTGVGAVSTAFPLLWSATWTRGGAGAGTCTSTMPAGSKGNKTRFVCVFADANDKMSMVSNGLQARVAAGERYVAQLQVTLTGITNLADMFFSVEWTANGVNYSSPACMGTGSDGQLTTDFSGILETDPFVIPSGLTALKLRFWLTGAGAGGVTCDIEQPVFKRETAVSGPLLLAA